MACILAFFLATYNYKLQMTAINSTSHILDAYQGDVPYDITGLSVNFIQDILVDELDKQKSINYPGVYAVSLCYDDGWIQTPLLDRPIIYVGCSLKMYGMKSRIKTFCNALYEGKKDTDSGRHSSAWSLNPKLSKAEMSDYFAHMVISYASFDKTTLDIDEVDDTILQIERGLIRSARKKWPTHLCNLR